MIVFECDCCQHRCIKADDEAIDVYELSQEVKDETLLPYDHLCRQCYKDLGDKTLYIRNDKIRLKRIANERD